MDESTAKKVLVELHLIREALERMSPPPKKPKKKSSAFFVY